MYLFFSNMKVMYGANMEGRKKITFFLVAGGGFICLFISFEVVLLFFGWRKKKRGSFQWCCVFLIFCCSHALIKSEIFFKKNWSSLPFPYMCACLHWNVNICPFVNLLHLHVTCSLLSEEKKDICLHLNSSV